MGEDLNKEMAHEPMGSCTDDHTYKHKKSRLIQTALTNLVFFFDSVALVEAFDTTCSVD